MLTKYCNTDWSEGCSATHRLRSGGHAASVKREIRKIERLDSRALYIGTGGIPEMRGKIRCLEASLASEWKHAIY